MNTQSENINDLAKALAAAQASLNSAKKDGANPHFNSKFATLQSVWNSAREVLAPNGLSIVQTFAATDGHRMDITTTLMHTSGQWIRGTLSMIPQRADPQGIGSAITYGRRYALAAILGIVADEDDDGEAASRPAQPARAAAPAAASRASAPAARSAVPATASNWRAVVVPKFIAKYAGKTLGDMEQDDLIYWATNYVPKPYQGKISEQDLAFRRSLDAAKAEVVGERPARAAAPASARAAGQQENLDEDVPF